MCQMGEKKPYSGFAKKKEREVNVASTSIGRAKAYRVPYYQVAKVAPSQYQQQAFAIPIVQQPITYQPLMHYQQPYASQC